MKTKKTVKILLPLSTLAFGLVGTIIFQGFSGFAAIIAILPVAIIVGGLYDKSCNKSVNKFAVWLPIVMVLLGSGAFIASGSPGIVITIALLPLAAVIGEMEDVQRK